MQGKEEVNSRNFLYILTNILIKKFLHGKIACQHVRVFFKALNEYKRPWKCFLIKKSLCKIVLAQTTTWKDDLWGWSKSRLFNVYPSINGRWKDGLSWLISEWRPFSWISFSLSCNSLFSMHDMSNSNTRRLWIDLSVFGVDIGHLLHLKVLESEKISPFKYCIQKIKLHSRAYSQDKEIPAYRIMM